MPYILEQLLTVREHREDKALNQLAQSKALLAQARVQKSHKERALADYCQWRLNEEHRLFEHLRNDSATIQDLMLFTDTVNTLRENQSARAQQVDDAVQQVAKAENHLKTARQNHVLACRKKMKIEAHKSTWNEEDQSRAEHCAEQETEELGQICFQP